MDSLQAGPVAGLPSDRAKTIVTICAVGKQSLYAMLLLKAQGYERVKSVKGGMQDWTRARHPLRVR